MRSFFGILLVLSLAGCALSNRIQIKEEEFLHLDAFNTTLPEIAQRVNESSALSAWALGGDDQIWKYLLEALLLADEVYTEIEMYGISIDYSDEGGNLELYITGHTTVWNISDVQVNFVLFIDSGLELALQFAYNGTQIPVQLWANNSQDWFSGLTLVGINTVSASTETFTDNKGRSFLQGLSLVANLETNEELPVQDSLYTLIHGPPSSDADRVPITGKLVAQFPLDDEQALTHWTLTVDGTIYFASPNVVSNNLVLDFQLTTSGADASMSCDVTITNLGGQGNPPVTFSTDTQISTSSGFNFNGDLQGTWVKPFGVTWIAFNTLDITFAFNPLATPTIASFTMAGGASVSFSNATEPITVNFNADISNGCQEVELDIVVPAVDLDQMFSNMLNGQEPLMISQLKVSGDVNFVISTYSGQYQEGVTVAGNIEVAQVGAIANAVKAFDPSPVWTYAFQLYVPTFSSTPQDIDFYLTETGPIKLSANVIMVGYHIEFDMTPTSEVRLTSSLLYNYEPQKETLTFDVYAQISGTSQQNTIAFGGSMEGTLDPAFGLSWLSLSNLEASLTISNGVIQAFSLQGTANVSFGALSDASVTIIIPGPTFSEFSFSITVLIDNMKTFLDSVGDPSRNPQLASEVSLDGTLTISTFAHDNYQAGITIDGDAMLLSDGKISDAILTFAPNCPMFFSVYLVLPIFSTTPWDVTLQFAENGTFALSKSVTVYGVAVDLIVGDEPEVAVYANTDVKLSGYNDPFHIVFSAALGGSVDLSVSGAIKGSWQPFQFSWFTANSATAVLSFAERELAAFGISGSGNITIVGSNEVSFAISTANDFFDSYIEITAITFGNLGDVIKAVTGMDPPPIIADIVTAGNNFEFILSSFTQGNILEGLTLSDNVTIDGQIVEQLKVFDQFGQIKSGNYGMGLTVPVFPGQTPDFNVQLSTPSVRISNSMLCEGFNIDVGTDPAALSISTQLYVNFTHNPELEFGVKGSFAVDGTISLSGYMVGTWDDMFGIKGVDVSNVEFAIGLSPDLCGVDLCLSQVGLGYNLSIGNSIVAFYGAINIPDLLDIFLEGELLGSDDMGLTFVDMALEWNNLVGNKLGIPIDTSNIPPKWGFTDSSFYIAPVSGTFNNINYQQGFWVDGGFNMFGIEVQADIKVTTGDFDFHVEINTTNFQINLNEQLNLMNGQVGGSVASVQNVTLSELSLAKYAKGKQANFYMEYEFFGGSHTADFGVAVLDLSLDFSDFFNTYLKNLFSSNARKTVNFN
eukprot:TRINITY_DN358_c0_g1_i1.p1 TRINITY_DN358_c0_g1~~TRINITY_DN358_c0_g1_i1.p1  ORF type:complete len:1260 (-),score=408.34 TRINITY_DN358_c0_g1_i1:42-3821(-)